jgi:uroporphyrinogen decarboxylase
VLWDIVEDLIGLGVEALHPIDPTCMDIEEVKEKLGDRLTIIGNISNEILETGTPDEVAELTKERIRVLGPGGGYCLGSGNSVPQWTPLENYVAMVETGLKLGKYPIKVE